MVEYVIDERGLRNENIVILSWEGIVGSEGRRWLSFAMDHRDFLVSNYLGDY